MSWTKMRRAYIRGRTACIIDNAVLAGGLRHAAVRGSWQAVNSTASRFGCSRTGKAQVISGTGITAELRLMDSILRLYYSRVGPFPVSGRRTTLGRTDGHEHRPGARL